MNETTAPGPNREFVLLTRRRWAYYFLPAIALVTILSVVFAVVFEQARSLTAPLPLALIWLLLRRCTPPNGTQTRKISATPGLLHLMVWWVLILLVPMVLFIVVEEPEGGLEPLKGYHYAVFLPLLVIFLLGVWRIERRYPSKKRR